jgi:uncharacterized SAM-binding protein YcdF (DUF218 family)
MELIPARWYLMLLMPSFVGATSILFALVVVATRARRGAAWPEIRRPMIVLFAALAMLHIAATPLAATWLSASLERMTPYLRPEDAPVADAIVVLGGGQSGYVTLDGRVHLHNERGADRLETGIRAFKAGKAPRLVLGGDSLQLPADAAGGTFLRGETMKRGVPSESILACGTVKYTTDEADTVAALLRPFGARRILLCTSATHMPRARIAYEQLGLEVICIPCDFDTLGEAEAFSPLMLLPRGRALAQTENGLKEWLGLIVARLRSST